MIHDICMQEWYTCKLGHEVDASRVQDKVCMERLKDMYYEVHLQVLITYYTEVLGQSLPKSEAKAMILWPKTDLPREIYVRVSRKH
jgi:hypothetical protein